MNATALLQEREFSFSLFTLVSFYLYFSTLHFIFTLYLPFYFTLASPYTLLFLFTFTLVPLLVLELDVVHTLFAIPLEKWTTIHQLHVDRRRAPLQGQP